MNHDKPWQRVIGLGKRGAFEGCYWFREATFFFDVIPAESLATFFCVTLSQTDFCPSQKVSNKFERIRRSVSGLTLTTGGRWAGKKGTGECPVAAGGLSASFCGEDHFSLLNQRGSWPKPRLTTSHWDCLRYASSFLRWGALTALTYSHSAASVGISQVQNIDSRVINSWCNCGTLSRFYILELWIIEMIDFPWPPIRWQFSIPSLFSE
jgi:hypothetical protein